MKGSVTQRDLARTARPEPAPLRPLDLPRRMTATDALFWYSESALPIFRPIIAGLYMLDRRPDPHHLTQGMDAALALVPRLSQRVVEAPFHIGLPAWVDDPHFDVGYHMRHFALPRPGSQRQLLDVVATLFATPLDRERPLWEAYWIDGLAGDRAAFFFKLHHSVVDGVGAMALTNALTQPTRTGAIPRVLLPTPHRRRPSRNGALAGLVALAADNAVSAGRMARDVAAAPLHFLAHPADGVAELGRSARAVRGAIADLMAPSIVDPLAEACSGLSRRFDVMQIPFERLVRIKEPLGVTINDVVLAVLAGALGAYHRERHTYVDVLNCMVPMSLRAAEDRDTLGNRVGTFLVRLPLAERAAGRRLQLITAQTRAAKSDRRGAASPALLQAVALLPGFAFRWFARQSLGKVNIACTNVPGVREPRFMAGARVEALYPFASVVEGTPVVVALLSYAGEMHVGIDTDPEAIPDPQRLHALLEDGLAQMERLAGVGRKSGHHAPARRGGRRRVGTAAAARRGA